MKMVRCYWTKVFQLRLVSQTTNSNAFYVNFLFQHSSVHHIWEWCIPTQLSERAVLCPWSPIYIIIVYFFGDEPTFSHCGALCQRTWSHLTYLRNSGVGKNVARIKSRVGSIRSSSPKANRRGNKNKQRLGRWWWSRWSCFHFNVDIDFDGMKLAPAEWLEGSLLTQLVWVRISALPVYFWRIILTQVLERCQSITPT